MMYEPKINQVVCGTGHRPDKLGGYSDEVLEVVFELALKVLEFHKPRILITGMAQGWDQMLAYAAYEMNIPYDAAVPFKGQERSWSKDSQDKYNFLLNNANEVKYISDKYDGPWVMQYRNEWMVDRSSVVLALWDGARNGGTYNCISYAERKITLDKWDISVVNYWDMFQQLKEG